MSSSPFPRVYYQRFQFDHIRKLPIGNVLRPAHELMAVGSVRDRPRCSRDIVKLGRKIPYDDASVLRGLSDRKCIQWQLNVSNLQ